MNRIPFLLFSPKSKSTSSLITSAFCKLFGLKKIGNSYSRIMNPTPDVNEKGIAAMGTGDNLVFTSFLHVTPTLLRISLGIEHTKDIKADLHQAFDKI